VDTHVVNIVPVLGEISLELGVLRLDGVLANMWQQEESEERRQDAQRSGDEEWILTSLDWVRSLISLVQDTENLGANESTNLASGSCNTVVLTTNTSSASLGCNQANVVTGTKFSEREEDTVDDDKATHVFDPGERSVATSHDEADDGLSADTEREGVTWAESVRYERSDDSAGHVEQVDNGVPAKALPERVVGTQKISRNCTREDAKTVAGKVVNKPDEGNDNEAEPVELDDQPPRSLGFVHAVTLECLWFPQSDTEIEQREWWDDSETQADTPSSS